MAKNTYYNTCPDCGAHLDPGETCDCQTEKKPDILYLCDRRACKSCYPNCSHTLDIAHAVNFEAGVTNGYFIEKERPSTKVTNILPREVSLIKNADFILEKEKNHENQ